MAKYFAPIRISENMHSTPEGYLLCVGVSIARTGDMLYGPRETPLDVGPDGTVMVERDEKEVFSASTIASFEGKPVTIGHPAQFVDPLNWSTRSKGIVQNVRRGTGDEKNDLKADLLITDLEAIGLVKRGLREVSCGYEAEYEQLAPGRGRQFNIIGNHLALVEQGRAGSAYAINDHKGVSEMTWKERLAALKAKFAKTADQVAQTADEGEVVEGEKTDDAQKAAYDELMSMCDALGEKIKAFGGAKDAKEDPPMPEEKAKDAEVNSALEGRLAALEEMVKKIMGAEAAEAEIITGDEMEEEKKSEDEMPEEKKEKAPTGDTIARAEILAPGLEPTSDIRSKALEAAYKTPEGKKAIDALLNGKKLTTDSASQVDHLFIAASELLKTQRKMSFAKTKTGDFSSTLSARTGAMSADELNKKNAAHYGTK